MKVLLLYLCVFTYVCAGQVSSNTTRINQDACKLIEIVQDREYQYQSPNYPNDYPAGKCSHTFKFEEGYQIQITVESLDLNGIQNDFVSVLPGNGEEGFKLVWRLNKEKVIFVHDTSVTIEFTANIASVDHTGFSIRVQTYGELTTTPIPTTQVNWPVPTVNDSIYNTVYLGGATYKKFIEKRDEFRTFMANMSSIYCEKHGIILAEEITAKNIDIYQATMCPIQWPNSETCIELIYATPVFVVNSSKYELSSENLNKIWTEYIEKSFDSFEWFKYEVPDNNYSMILWLGISLIVLVVFFGFLFFMKNFSFRISDYISHRRASDMDHIIQTPKRVSDASLWPMSSQVVPPLFDNENAYSYYEPDMVTTTMKPSEVHVVGTKNMMPLDDSSDEEILNVNSVSQRSSYNQNVITLNLNDDPHGKESAL